MKWIACYMALSRVRCLSELRSIGLTSSIENSLILVHRRFPHMIQYDFQRQDCPYAYTHRRGLVGTWLEQLNDMAARGKRPCGASEHAASAALQSTLLCPYALQFKETPITDMPLHTDTHASPNTYYLAYTYASVNPYVHTRMCLSNHMLSPTHTCVRDISKLIQFQT